MGSKQTNITLKFETKTVSLAGVETDFVSYFPLNSGRVGKDDPHWKSKVKRGTNATNDLSAWRATAGFTYSSALAKAIDGVDAGKTFYTSTGHPPPVMPPVPSTALVTRASSEAAQNILKKIQRQSKSLSGTTFLGELRESVRMIKRPAEALADKLNKHVEKLSKKRPKRPSESWNKTVAESWLEGVFGWMPLISDIHDIAEASIQKFDEPRIKRLSDFGVEEDASSQTLVRTAGGASIYYHYGQEITHQVKVIYLCGYKVQIDTSEGSLGRIVESSGLGTWQDAVVAGWELVPWSFLVDYFSNIGNVINAAVTSTSNVSWSQRTTVSTSKRTYQGIAHEFRSPTYVQVASSLGYSSATKTTVEREAAGISIPDIRFSLPKSNLKLANIAALLGSRFL